MRTGAGRSLKGSVVSATVGNFVYGACQWAVLIVLARLGTPRGVGMFALSLALSAPVLSFANLHLRTFQATDAEGEFAFADYLGLRLATSGLALVVIGILAAAQSHDRDTALVVLVVGVAKIIESVSDVVYGLLQQRERLSSVARSMVAKGLLSLAAVWGVMVTTHSVVAVAGALAVSWGLLLVFYDLPLASRVLMLTESGPKSDKSEPSLRWLRYPAPRWRYSRIRTLTKAALPLGAANLMETLRQNAPRYVVSGALGVAALGVFAVPSYFVTIGARVIMSIGQATSARLSRLAAARDTERFRRFVLRLALVAVCVGVPGVLVSLIAGRAVLSTLYGAPYASQVNVFIWIMAAGCFEYFAKMLQFVLIALRYGLLQLGLDALALVTVTLVAIVAVPRIGALGAALAMFAACAAQAIGGATGSALAWRRMRSSTNGLVGLPLPIGLAPPPTVGNLS